MFHKWPWLAGIWCLRWLCTAVVEFDTNCRAAHMFGKAYMLKYSAKFALLVRGLSKRGISECVHRAHCCLTQWVHPTVCLCSSDTVESLDSVGSPVPVKSNNSISDGLWYSSRRLHWMSKRFKKQFGECKELDHVSAAECRGAKFCSTRAHMNSDNLEVPTFLHVGISSKCQIIHLEQVTQTFRDLLGECQSRTMKLYKALDKVQYPLASHSAAWGEEVRHPGLRRLGLAALIKRRPTCNLRLCAVS